MLHNNKKKNMQQFIFLLFALLAAVMVSKWISMCEEPYTVAPPTPTPTVCNWVQRRENMNQRVRVCGPQ